MLALRIEQKNENIIIHVLTQIKKLPFISTYAPSPGYTVIEI